jgi:hypothetical protein
MMGTFLKSFDTVFLGIIQMPNKIEPTARRGSSLPAVNVENRPSGGDSAAARTE